MIRSINEIYPNAHHLLCIFHIDLNLRKKLKGKLGKHFEEFRRKFYTCRNSLCEELFEHRWTQLVNQYPDAAKYLSDTLYSTKESWGIPWVYKNFIAGAQSNNESNQSINIYTISLIVLRHCVIYYLASRNMLKIKNILKDLRLSEMLCLQLGYRC